VYEVELKLRTGHGRVRERLDALGAEPLGRVEQVDTYYDAPHRSFAETDEALRVREERTDGDRANGDGTDGDRANGDGTDGDRTIRITYKGPLVEAASKTREEHETTVGDGAETRAILDGLGFAPAATVRKERERFAYEGYTVTLDTVEGLGEFVEVETEAEAVEAAREGAVAVLRELGLDPDEQVRTSYLGLLLDAGDTRG
jgi:adenylate cyclase class 2